MARLIATTYPGELRALEVLTAVEHLRGQGQLPIDDLCAVLRPVAGHTALVTSLPARTPWSALLGFVADRAPPPADASLHLTYGVEPAFTAAVHRALVPGSSALVVRVAAEVAEQVAAELAGFGGAQVEGPVRVRAVAHLGEALAAAARAVAADPRVRALDTIGLAGG